MRKGGRRTQDQLEFIYDFLIAVVLEEQPVTVRRVFYAGEVAGVFAKTKHEYQACDRYLIKLRRDKRIPYGAISDGTRWQRKPISDDGLEAALLRTVNTYRCAVWAEQDVYVEIWLEKDALAGTIVEVTSEFDVPLMVSRGCSSLSFLHSAAESIAAIGKPTFLYLLFDHDPGGAITIRQINKELKAFLPEGFPITIDTLAVTDEQIRDWQLPTRETTKADRRLPGFGPVSVDLDAIPMPRLRSIVRDAITQHIDTGLWERTQRIEAQERHVVGMLKGTGYFTRITDAVDDLVSWEPGEA